GLRQVQRVLPFQVAAADAVADRVADDGAARVDRERQFGLRHVPGRIAPNPYGLAGPGDAMRRGLEEQLRTVGRVDPIGRAAAALAGWNRPARQSRNRRSSSLFLNIPNPPERSSARSTIRNAPSTA